MLFKNTFPGIISGSLNLEVESVSVFPDKFIPSLHCNTDWIWPEMDVN